MLNTSDSRHHRQLLIVISNNIVTFLDITLSTNGRSNDFESENVGSTPTEVSKKHSSRVKRFQHEPHKLKTVGSTPMTATKKNRVRGSW